MWRLSTLLNTQQGRLRVLGHVSSLTSTSATGLRRQRRSAWLELDSRRETYSGLVAAPPTQLRED